MPVQGIQQANTRVVYRRLAYPALVLRDNENFVMTKNYEIIIRRFSQGYIVGLPIYSVLVLADASLAFGQRKTSS